jgi:hypothetical protein
MNQPIGLRPQVFTKRIPWVPAFASDPTRQPLDVAKLQWVALAGLCLDATKVRTWQLASKVASWFPRSMGFEPAKRMAMLGISEIIYKNWISDEWNWLINVDCVSSHCFSYAGIFWARSDRRLFGNLTDKHDAAKKSTETCRSQPV